METGLCKKTLWLKKAQIPKENINDTVKARIFFLKALDKNQYKGNVINKAIINVADKAKCRKVKIIAVTEVILMKLSQKIAKNQRNKSLIN